MTTRRPPIWEHEWKDRDIASQNKFVTARIWGRILEHTTFRGETATAGISPFCRRRWRKLCVLLFGSHRSPNVLGAQERKCSRFSRAKAAD